MDKAKYTTSTYRIAVALVANGHRLEGILINRSLSPKLYVFKESKQLYEDLEKIEAGSDKVPSLALYYAQDFLTRRVVDEQYRKHLDNELNSQFEEHD